MRKILSLLFGAALVLGLAAAPSAAVEEIGGTPSTPVSDGGITPYIINGENPGGNRTCAEVGTAFFGDPNYYEFSSARVNYAGASPVGGLPAGLTVTTDGTYVEFTSTFAIGAVIVKGSDDANVYVYDPQRTSDSGLAAPVNASGGSAGLSNITFCWNLEEGTGYWCSPGFWRNSPLAIVKYTGVDVDSVLYSSLQGAPPLKKGAPANPTLAQVLAAPQTYGGEAFNAVGDYLSSIAFEDDFDPTRPDGACPLPADASGKNDLV